MKCKFRWIYFMALLICLIRLPSIAQNLSDGYEIRYFSKDTKANGETDFKGDTSTLPTDQRIASLKYRGDQISSYYGDKELNTEVITDREAVAECAILLTHEACAQLIKGTPKGNPLEAARIAGIMATKRTAELLPFCHPIALTGAEVRVEPEPEAGRIRVESRVRARDRTGVEMEALTAAAVAALCLYDTAKPYDRAAEIGGLRLVSKSGGKGGDYRAERSSS